MDTLRGNRRRAAMSHANVKRELALAPAPVASDMLPIELVADIAIGEACCDDDMPIHPAVRRYVSPNTGGSYGVCAMHAEEYEREDAAISARLDGGMAPLRATSHVNGQRPL